MADVDYAQFKVKSGKYKDCYCYAKYQDWLDNDIVECFIEQDYEIARKAKLVRTNMELQDLHIKLTD